MQVKLLYCLSLKLSTAKKGSSKKTPRRSSLRTSQDLQLPSKRFHLQVSYLMYPWPVKIIFILCSQEFLSASRRILLLPSERLHLKVSYLMYPLPVKIIFILCSQDRSLCLQTDSSNESRSSTSFLRLGGDEANPPRLPHRSCPTEAQPPSSRLQENIWDWLSSSLRLGGDEPNPPRLPQRS